MATTPPMSQRVLVKPRRLDSDTTGKLLDITPKKAGWEFVHFAVHRIGAGKELKIRTRDEECALVLLSGGGEVTIDEGTAQRFGPRASVFDSYPHSVYLPDG